MAKLIVSYSLGNSSRDKEVEADFNGHAFILSRRGYNGNIAALTEAIQRNELQADVMTLGGIDFALEFLDRSYPFRQAKPLRAAAGKRLFVDGANFKRWVEPVFFKEIFAQGVLPEKANVLFPLGANRLFLAKAMEECGYNRQFFGDLIYNVGFPRFLIRGLSSYNLVGHLLAGLIVQLPFAWIYSANEAEDVHLSRRKDLFFKAGIIAGDYHGFAKFLPDNLAGKIIITNTVTEENLNTLRGKGIKGLVTFSAGRDGRFFGANMLDGVITAFLADKQLEINSGNYLWAVTELGMRPAYSRLVD